MARIRQEHFYCLYQSCSELSIEFGFRSCNFQYYYFFFLGVFLNSEQCLKIQITTKLYFKMSLMRFHHSFWYLLIYFIKLLSNFHIKSVRPAHSLVGNISQIHYLINSSQTLNNFIFVTPTFSNFSTNICLAFSLVYSIRTRLHNLGII